jgi:uncharacterized membrane protein
LVYRITRKVVEKRREEGFRWGQIATASLVALSHGTNDAQKTMGVIALALITTGHLTGDVKKDGLPFWIIFSCALAIAGSSSAARSPSASAPTSAAGASFALSERVWSRSSRRRGSPPRRRRPPSF